MTADSETLALLVFLDLCSAFDTIIIFFSRDWNMKHVLRSQAYPVVSGVAQSFVFSLLLFIIYDLLLGHIF